jgi:DUF4097 and DUF4098 domain-containing protein YvlB
MPTFDTPTSISVTVDLSVGAVRIAAGDRTDTVVEVRPSDETDESDVQAARQVRVDYANGALRVTGPRGRMFDFSRRTRSVDVTIELPAGSDVSAETQMGDFRCTGRLGGSRFKTSAGNVWLERTGPLHLNTSAGHVGVDAVDGTAEISTGTGKVQVGRVDGTAVVKNSNGETVIGTVTGDVRVRSANGDITVERAGAGVDAKTSMGRIRLGEIARGSVVLASSMGELEIGIAAGTAAWLDLDTGFGHVRNLLDPTDRPAETDETVEVRGRTTYGDITIHRSRKEHAQ